jgi:hypothetical protein
LATHSSFHDPEHHAGDLELVGFLDHDVREFQIRGMQDCAPFLAQKRLHDRLAVERSNDDISRAGFLRVINQDQVLVLDLRLYS